MDKTSNLLSRHELMLKQMTITMSMDAAAAFRAIFEKSDSGESEFEDVLGDNNC